MTMSVPARSAYPSTPASTTSDRPARTSDPSRAPAATGRARWRTEHRDSAARAMSAEPEAGPPAAERLAQREVVVATVALGAPVGEADRADDRVGAQEHAAGRDPTVEPHARA